MTTYRIVTKQPGASPMPDEVWTDRAQAEAYLAEYEREHPEWQGKLRVEP